MVPADGLRPLSPDGLSTSGSRVSVSGLEMRGQLPVSVAAMRDFVFLLISHLGECLLRSVRLEPGVPSEVTFAARLDQNLARGDSAENVALRSIPIRDAAFRFRGAVVERVGNRGEAFAARCFEEPPDVRTREVAKLVEAEGDVFDDETVVAL